jgi:dUTP pyrophosphatase
MLTVKFKFVAQGLSDLEKQSLIPQQKTKGAAGFDIASSHRQDLLLHAGDRYLVSTGIAISLPPHFEGQVRSRSGLAAQHGIIVLNAPGTIDADYRGEIKVILANMSHEPFKVSFGMRIAQLVIAPVASPELIEAVTLEPSERGEAGFGSTGLTN